MSSPIIQYSLNTSSLGEDSSGNSLDATNTDVTLVTDAERGLVGSFNGSSSALTLPEASVPVALTGGNERTIIMRVKRTGTNRAVFFVFGKQSGTFVQMNSTTNNSNRFNIDVGSHDSVSSFTIEEDVWYHLAFTYTPSTYIGYVNGVQQNSISRTLNTGVGDLFIGSSATLKFEGFMSDLRVYDVALSASQILADSQELSLTLYTHVADISWPAIAGASTYSVRKTEAGGSDEIDVVSGTSDLLYTDYDLMEATNYVYRLYTDVSPTTIVLTVSGTTPVVDSTSVALLLTKVSNDLSILSVNATESISTTLRDVLSTGDVLETHKGSVTFVADTETLTLSSGATERVLTPFETSAGAGQTVTITLPDASTEVLTYDDGADEVISATVNYATGEYFKSGTYKVTVAKL